MSLKICTIVKALCHFSRGQNRKSLFAPETKRKRLLCRLADFRCGRLRALRLYIFTDHLCLRVFKNLEDLKEHTFKNYQEHPIGVPVIIEWGRAIDKKNYADRKGCLETKLRLYIGGNIPLYRWYIACIFQISSAPAGYEEFAEGIKQITNGEIFWIHIIIKLLSSILLHKPSEVTFTFRSITPVEYPGATLMPNS